MSTDTSHWQQASLSSFTDHIVGHHHAYLNRELPLIGELLTAQVRAHWRQHPELLEAHSILGQARALVEQHLIKEETAGFPLLSAHERDASVSIAPFSGSIDGHIAEHARITELFSRLRSTLWDYRAPEGTGPEMAALCDRLGKLHEDLAQHIHLEDEILFPRVRAMA